jgi:chromate transporter
MHRLIVDERRWISEQRLHALNFCMLRPGPEAMQLATYVGWRLHGTIGGLAAGLLFVLPGAAIVLALSIAYAYYGKVPLVEAAFLGVKAAVLVIVIEALLRMAKRALRGPYDVAIAAAAFVAIFFFSAAFPFIILAAAAIGFLLANARPSRARAASSLDCRSARSRPPPCGSRSGSCPTATAAIFGRAL